MENKQPKFIIMGSFDKINYVLNKLPNKNKNNHYYVLDIEEPFIEYSFFLDKEDEYNNMGEFKIMVCPNKELLNVSKYMEYLNLIYNTNAIILCHDNSYEIYNTKKLLEKEIIHIWFDNIIPKSYNNEFNYKFDNNEWINKIFDYLDIPYGAPSDTQCNIL